MNNRIVRESPRFTLFFSFLLFFLFPILLHAATFTVNNTTDTVDANPGDGLCANHSGACTLRAAIQEANAISGADRINLPTGTYILNIEGRFEDEAATGDLDITDDLTIIGDSAADTKINADKIDGVLSIKGAINVEISGVTIMHGFRSFGGGGIRNEEGIVTLINSMVTKNFSTNGSGIDNGGTLTLINSTVSNNSDIPSGEGGSGIYNIGTLILLNSTISDNGFEAPMSIGGIANGSEAGATTTLKYSTISGNKGVGIGGVSFGPANGTVTLIGSIIATNTSKDCDQNGFVQNQFFSLDYNIDSDGSCNLTQPHDLPNTDPIIGPLADNGGPTLTHALLSSSPAIDAADPNNCPPPNTDQRGKPRPVDGNQDGIVVCDIGSYEFSQPPCPHNPGDYDYCRDCGPCEEGQGDCDSDNECENGRTCVQIAGEVDVCEAPTVCPHPIGHWDYCKDCGPCDAGQGDCDLDSECQNGLPCVLVPGMDVCCPHPIGHLDYCRDCGPCYAGQGDCDRDSECQSGLTCAKVPGVDVCCPHPIGHWDYCRDCGPCRVGQGDCDRDSECGVGLVCEQISGAVDVCEYPSSQ